MRPLWEKHPLPPSAARWPVPTARTRAHPRRPNDARPTPGIVLVCREEAASVLASAVSLHSHRLIFGSFLLLRGAWALKGHILGPGRKAKPAENQPGLQGCGEHHRRGRKPGSGVAIMKVTGSQTGS